MKDFLKLVWLEVMRVTQFISFPFNFIEIDFNKEFDQIHFLVESIPLCFQKQSINPFRLSRFK